jgi:hypothetical protein
MTRVRRLLCACVVAACAATIGASAASARTFYVNERGESKTCEGPGRIGACATIKEAIERTEGFAPPNTIEVEEGTYEEQIELNSIRDQKLTINGEFDHEEVEPEVVDKSGSPFVVRALAKSVTLANMRMLNKVGEAPVLAVHGAALTLENMAISNEAGKDGVQATEGGSLTIDGGTIEMEAGELGYAVSAEGTPLSLNGVTIAAGEQLEDRAGGIYSRGSTLSVADSTVRIGSGPGLLQYGIGAFNDSSVSLQNDTVKQNSLGYGVALLEDGPTTASNVHVEMQQSSSKVEAVGDIGPGAAATFEHLEVGGTWEGQAFLGQAAEATIADSHLVASGAHVAPSVEYKGSGEGRGLLIQRSVVQAAYKATPGALDAVGGNVTVDSSEILGGTNGVFFESTEGTRTLTIASSTVGAPPGLSIEKSGVVGVDANASGKGPSTAQVAIEGSIFIQPQADTAAAGDKAAVTCTYSAIPSQVQTPNNGTHAGEIGCASGLNGNANSSSEFASLFSEHLVNYKLSPSSTAIDSVPVGAIALPFGLTPSTTDLEGNPRFESVACSLLQDKGALELPGHGTPCPKPIPPASPPPPTPKPLKAVLSALTISPSAFFPAPSGASVSAAAAKRKKYGAKISYHDSQVATATFTVLRPTSGRMQGRSCRKPSKHNKHGRLCTLYVPVGSFTHADKAAANSFHFSGRLKGKRLAPGTYRLQAIAHDTAGNGATVEKGFKIEA